jgi:uncharacterized membrane protein
MLQSTFFVLFLGAAILAIIGVLVYLSSAINRLERTIRNIGDSIDSTSRTRAPQTPAPTPAPAPAAPAPAPAAAPALALSTAPAPAPAVPCAPEPEGIDEGVLAAIAAAISTVIRQPHRIVAIQPDAGAQLAWSAEGRRELYHSHKIR